MADTIVNTPGSSQDSGAAAWALAIVVILAVLIGGFFLLRRVNPGVPNTGDPGTNINVTVPSTGGTGGGGGTGSGGGTGY